MGLPEKIFEQAEEKEVLPSICVSECYTMEVEKTTTIGPFVGREIFKELKRPITLKEYVTSLLVFLFFCFLLGVAFATAIEIIISLV